MKSATYIIRGALTFLMILFAGVNIVQAQNTIADIISESENHTIFAELLEETEMKDLLEEEGPFTVLAPTNDAFLKLGDDFEEIKRDNNQLQNLVLGHLFNGQISASDIENSKSINLKKGDIKADNGRVHIIEEVLID